jgi:type I restriction enzyme M protein
MGLSFLPKTAPVSNNLPAAGVIALEIVEDFQAALLQFKLIASDLGQVVEE